MLIYLVTLISTLVFLKGTESTISNVTESNNLSEIRYGMKCIYGKLYKMECNTCRCGHHNALLCTKAACLNTMDSDITHLEQKKFERKESDLEDIQVRIVEKKKKFKKTERKPKIHLRRPDSKDFPALPPTKNCVPGRIYQVDCKRCFCKANGQSTCSITNACIKPKVTRDLIPEEVRPRVRDKEFKSLPVLAHAASPCTPGNTYKVECNVCICDEYQNLICDKLLCISFEEMHRAQALKKSGLPCNSKNYEENEAMQSECVQCTCNGTTYCTAKENCVAKTEMMRTLGSSGNGSRLTYDYTTENCLPDHIYKDNCNNCYCQSDQSLRCTQKICLNYKQAVILEKQHYYLREHGL